MADAPDIATVVSSLLSGGLLTWAGKAWFERRKHKDEQEEKVADRQARIVEHYDKSMLELVGTMRTQIQTIRAEAQELAEENLRLRRLERRFVYLDEGVDLLTEWIDAKQHGGPLEAVEHKSRQFVTKVQAEATAMGDMANELQRRVAASRLLGGEDV